MGLALLTVAAFVFVVGGAFAILLLLIGLGNDERR